MTRLASGPGSAEPLTAITRSDEVSSRRRWSASASSIRCSMTGTTTSASACCSETARTVSRGSKRRRSTIVEDSAVASSTWAKPQA